MTLNSENFVPGTTLAHGRYRIERLLGVGGMGTVYEATEMALKRTVALKVLLPELSQHPTARQRMEAEAQAMARLNSPNVVRVNTVFDEQGMLVIDLEYMSGGSLADRLAAGPVSEGQAARWIIQILKGLEALHKAGLVHRDLKPANVLFDDEGVAKVGDLGIVHDGQRSTQLRTRHDANLGTAEYMAPEQVQSAGTADERSDLYSAGVILYEVLTGRVPFAGEEWSVKAAHVREAADLAPVRAVSVDLVGVVARALQKLPAERYSTAREMRKAVAEAASWAEATSEPLVKPRPARGAKSTVSAARDRVIQAEPVEDADDHVSRNRQSPWWPWPLGAGVVALVVVAAVRCGTAASDTASSVAKAEQAVPVSAPVAPEPQKADAPVDPALQALEANPDAPSTPPPAVAEEAPSVPPPGPELAPAGGEGLETLAELPGNQGIAPLLEAVGKTRVADLWGLSPDTFRSVTGCAPDQGDTRPYLKTDTCRFPIPGATAVLELGYYNDRLYRLGYNWNTTRQKFAAAISPLGSADREQRVEPSWALRVWNRDGFLVRAALPDGDIAAFEWWLCDPTQDAEFQTADQTTLHANAENDAAMAALAAKPPQVAAAEAGFRRALGLVPNYTRARLRLCSILLDQAKYDDAQRQCELVLATTGKERVRTDARTSLEKIGAARRNQL